MKALRALILVLALSVCTYAGNMGNGVATPPPPPPTAPSSATTAPGASADDSTGQIETDATATDSFTEITLNLLQSVLSLI